VPTRKLEKKDLEVVSSICMKAFMHSVAPSLSGEGIDTFREIASADAFSERFRGDNTILVFEETGQTKGLIELKEGRHVAMLFIDPEFQKQGIGRELVSAVIAYTRTDAMTVSASLNSVSAYLQYGFICAGEPDEKSGLKYQPMKLELNKSRKKDALKGASS
jgi:GNAT superfamily N-acetyltransferase